MQEQIMVDSFPIWATLRKWWTHVPRKKTSIEYGYTGDELHLVYPVEIKPSEDYDDEFYDVEKVDPSQ